MTEKFAFLIQNRPKKPNTSTIAIVLVHQYYCNSISAIVLLSLRTGQYRFFPVYDCNAASTRFVTWGYQYCTKTQANDGKTGSFDQKPFFFCLGTSFDRCMDVLLLLQQYQYLSEEYQYQYFCTKIQENDLKNGSFKLRTGFWALEIRPTTARTWTRLHVWLQLNFNLQYLR